MTQPYDPPRARVDDAAAKHPDERLRRATVATVSAVAAQTTGLVAMIDYFDADPLRIQWAKLLPLCLVAVAMTSTLCAMLPLRRRWILALLAAPLSILAFLAIGTTLSLFLDFA
jgi:peptidoglycan/LPS O-acetylase OafA/YrhL